MSTDARTEILARIRKAVGRGAASPATGESWAAIPRAYRRSSNLSPAMLIEQLTDRLHDYDATVKECVEAELPGVIAACIAARGAHRMLVPVGFPAGWLGGPATFVVEEALSIDELNSVDGVLTEATLAIAETGTIVLQNVPGQGRRAASLVPDYHLCVVRQQAVLGSVPEAMEQLAATAILPTTFISGPSATADIEMTRIKGVHGPRFLDVVLYR